MSRCPSDLGLIDADKCLECQNCWEKALAEHDAKVRVETIEEFYNRLSRNKASMNTANYPWNYVDLVYREMTGMYKE